MNILKVGFLILLSIVDNVVAFGPSSSLHQHATIALKSPTNKEGGLNGSMRLLTIATLANDDDDDGWGTSDMLEEKTEELRSLQTSRSSSVGRSNSSNSEPSEEQRDLFIPIFAVVSLLGLFGTYGYEMARLASRGELYLPWNK
eukprot:scaffold2638_cov114-Cylindrotheca_fusiformis.AAC.15